MLLLFRLLHTVMRNFLNIIFVRNILGKHEYRSHQFSETTGAALRQR